MIYVALLRGINVGGNNKVDMKKLKVTFEGLGFTNVVTYINSGNIVFKENLKNKVAIAQKIEKAISKDFGLDIKVLIRSFEDMEMVCTALPESWVKNDIMKTDIMFLWEEFDNTEVLELLKLSPYDNVKYVKGAILWNLEIKYYGKSGLPKIIGTKLYKNITIRNINTVRKLYQIMSNIKN